MYKLQVILAIILILTLFKDNEELFSNDQRSGGGSAIFLRMLRRIQPPLIFAISFLLVNIGWEYGPQFGALLLLLIMFTGFILKRLKVIEKCNCYGDLTKGNQKKSLVLSLVMAIFSLAILFKIQLTEEVYTSKPNFKEEMIFATVGMFLSILLIYKKLSKRTPLLDIPTPVSPISHTAKKEVIKNKVVFSSGMALGQAINGMDIELGSISSSVQFAFLIGLRSDCFTCNEVKPQLLRLAETFKAEIRTIFLCNEQIKEGSFPQDLIVLRENEDFSRLVDAQQYPFCMLINLTDYSQIGELTYGAPEIWNLFFRVLNISIKQRQSSI